MSTDTGHSQANTRIDYWYGRTIGYEEVYVAVRDLTTVAVVRGYSEDGSPWIEVGPPFDLKDEYEVDPSEVPTWAKSRVRDFFYLNDTSISSLLERTNNGEDER